MTHSYPLAFDVRGYQRRLLGVIRQNGRLYYKVAKYTFFSQFAHVLRKKRYEIMLLFDFNMLIRVGFTNMRSFRDRQDLSLVAGPFRDQPETPRFIRPIKESLLPAMAIYGSNASGKSNALRAISFIADAVVFSQSTWKPDDPIPYQPFWNVEGTPPPSEFEIEFLAGGVRYRYGFVINSRMVLEEWLHAYPKGKKQSWFHRAHDKPMTFSAKLPGENRTIESLTRKNALFLSAAAQNNHEALSTPYRWISGLQFVLDYNRELCQPYTAQLCKSSEYLAAVSELISFADLGITGAKVVTHPVAEGMKIISKLEDSIRAAGTEMQRDPIERLEIQLLHRFGATEVPFNAQQESQGTLAYLGLLGPVVSALNRGMPLIVDELDGSLHPLLSAHIVRLFNNPATNPRNAQLIFNTHDTSLLNCGLLRRDQIWFSEKTDDGSTHLYPLSDFKLRRTDNMQSGYLMGRYGAIPFINAEALLSDFQDIRVEKS